MQLLGYRLLRRSKLFHLILIFLDFTVQKNILLFSYSLLYPILTPIRIDPLFLTEFSLFLIAVANTATVELTNLFIVFWLNNFIMFLTHLLNIRFFKLTLIYWLKLEWNLYASSFIIAFDQGKRCWNWEFFGIQNFGYIYMRLAYFNRNSLCYQLNDYD